MERQSEDVEEVGKSDMDKQSVNSTDNEKKKRGEINNNWRKI